MVNRKKKKGSSILITVGMFAMLSILIMSVLAMTTSGYSLRIKNNKRIENFYAADSGLEISQKVLHDYLGKVVKASLNKVDEYVQSKPDGKLSQSEKEEKFQEFFKDIILNGGTLKDDTGNVIEQLKTVKDEVELPSNYDSFKRDGKNIEIQSEIKSLKKDGTEIVIPTIPYKDINKFSLNVKSNFTDKDNKDREVEVDFDILIPEYGKLLVRAKNSKAPNILNYIVGVDGDYTITTDTTTSVLGDMWVKGNTPNDREVNSENKYDGGIVVRQPEGSAYSAPEVRWDGTIATNGTLNISNIIFKSGLKGQSGEENIFARNIKIDNSKNKTGDSSLFGDETNLHVYNDFLLEGIKNKIVLKNFYGLNDINDYEKNWENKKLKNAQKSSSMIINSEDFGNGSSIDIKNDLYILGTSYLDLKGDDYQTGQSTIMNNISRPYTIRDCGEKEHEHEPEECPYNEYFYQYKTYGDSGIHIATKDKDGNELILGEVIEETGEAVKPSKLALAKKFYETNTDYFNAGLTVPEDNIASTGVILANNQAIARAPRLEQIEKAEKKQGEFAKEVFYMGNNEGSYDKKEFWNNKVNETVNSSFNWNGISDIAQKDHNGDSSSSIIDIGGNNRDFIHITSKKTLNEIMVEAKNDGHELGKYGNRWATATSAVPHIILSNSDKELVLRNTGTGNPKLEKETDSQIIYNVNIGNGVDAPPLLVIAKGKIAFEPFNGYNHIMLISADNAEIKVPYGDPAIIGNYDSGTSEGKQKLINELFKYILEKDSILGGVGGSILLGSEDRVTTNAIEVSHLIKSKNWKINK